jgi:aryl-alcohol dehydrogenase-like predicted oxidoreductase
MIYRELGKSGINISAVGLGTWAIGGMWWGGTDEELAVAALQRGLDEGINLIDTAPVYGYGLSEEVVGLAIKGRDRAGIILATKVGLAWHVQEGSKFFELEGKTVYRNLRPAGIRYEIEQSLRRLDTDYIDLYQTHWQDPTFPIADTMAELLKLREEGKIRAIGVSNATPAQMREYLAVGRIDSNQPLYNMLDRGIEEEALPFCREHDIAILSYSSLALGLLTGKADPNRTFPSNDLRACNPRFKPENIARVNALFEQFAPLREKYGLNQAQLSIAWTISRPGVTCSLVGVRNPAQAADIAPGGNVELTPEELAEMDRTIAELGSLT